VSAISTAPFTFGQLSVWRDVEQLPDEKRHEANISRVSPIDADVSVAEVLGAFGRLRSRHEALRTTYVLDDPARPRQIVHPAGELEPALRLVTVEAGADPIDVARRVGEETAGRPFDLALEESWRATVLITDGRPSHLVLVLHHIAVDFWALTLLRDDFQALLGAQTPAPPDSPRDLALAQRSDQWLVRRAAAEKHVREVYTIAAHAPAFDVVESPAAAVKATLRSHIAPAAASVKAESLKISVPSLVLAAYCFAVHQITGVDDILVNTMCANRIYSGTAALVSSMNQWALFVSQRTAGESFDQFAQRVHWASLRAYRRGCYDPDQAARIREDVATSVGPIGPEFFFNFVATGVPPAAVSPTPAWYVEKQPPLRTGGHSFYLVATQGDDLALSGRVMWEGFDDAALENFLITIHEALCAPS
jgi:hypothetical protein